MTTGNTGLLAKQLTAAGAPVKVYTAPATAKYVIVDVLLVNLAATDSIVSLAFSTAAGAPAAVDAIEAAATVPGFGQLERTRMMLGANESVFVTGDTNTVAIRVTGIEELP